MNDIGFFEQLSDEISNTDIPNLIFIALLFYIPFRFSKKADSLFFHLFYSFIAIYMLLTMHDARIIYDVKLLVGLGLLIPQVTFIIQFTRDTIQTTKMMTANTYYFFITLYYKILRFINWIRSIYVMIISFFQARSTKKTKQKYQEQTHQENSYNQQEYQEFYEEYKKQKDSEARQEQTSQKQDYSKDEKYSRFYSSSAYIVLGVSDNDDYKTIKKAYRKIVREYHPDLNPQNKELYTEITQNINNAWEKISSWKKP